MGWYLIALLLSGLVYVFGASAYRSISGQPIALFYLSRQSQHWLMMLLIPLVEEPGWRGYAMPRLARRFGAFPASLWLGVAWSASHVVMFALQGMSPEVMAWGLLHIVAGWVLFGWLFQRTAGSVCIAIVAHVGAHLNNPVHALPDGTPVLIHAVSTCVVAASLMLDRGAWRKLQQAEVEREG